MLQQLLYISGIDRKLHALKQQAEVQAHLFVERGQATALRIALALLLFLAALAIAALGLGAAAVALFFGLQPRFGDLEAAAIVAAVLFAVGLCIAGVGMTLLRRSTTRQSFDAGGHGTTSSFGETTGPRGNSASYEQVADPISPAQVNSLLAVAARLVGIPQFGAEPIDGFFKAIGPQLEDVAKDAIARGATLVRNGDRTTMLTILSAATVLGWLLTKRHDQPRGTQNSTGG